MTAFLTDVGGGILISYMDGAALGGLQGIQYQL